MSNQKILIVGGGFSGIKAALELSKGDNSKFDITLVSDKINFRYYPALYRTATGGVVAGSSIPLTTILSDKKVKIVRGTAETIDCTAQTLTLLGGEVLNYDIIILGLGVDRYCVNWPTSSLSRTMNMVEGRTPVDDRLRRGRTLPYLSTSLAPKHSTNSIRIISPITQ